MFYSISIGFRIVPYASAFLHSSQLLVTVVKGIAPKRHAYFYSLVLEFVLCYSISYPIVSHTPAFAKFSCIQNMEFAIVLKGNRNLREYSRRRLNIYHYLTSRRLKEGSKIMIPLKKAAPIKQHCQL